MSVQRVAAVFICFTLVACSTSTPQQEPVVVSPASVDTKLSAPFDLGAVMRQVRFAYRPEGEGWRGGHATYDVRVGGEGLELRPYHHPRRERAEAVDDRGERDLTRPEPIEGDPLKLAPSRIRVGGRLLTEGGGRAEQQQDGTLKLVRDVGTERLVNGEEGVEQSWAFQVRPAGKGDLVVEIPVTGLAYAGVTDGGLHFRDESTGLGFRYGHGTWIDADDQRNAIPARFERGAIVLSVPEKLLASSAFPAVLDPVISPEFGMDEPVYGPAANDQYESAVASNGSDYLVVWRDIRKETTSDIYGTRVSAKGVVLDPTGLVISAAARDQRAPAVASNGTDYLVTWQDDRNGSDIYGARVSAAGVVRDEAGLLISAATGAQRNPTVTSNGADYFVAWEDRRNGSTDDIYGTRVSAAGVVQDSVALVISAAVNNQWNPKVASNGTDYFVVWADYRSGSSSDIYGTRVSAAGVVQDAAGLVVSAAADAQSFPAVASNGTSYFVAWEDYRSGSVSDIYGTRISAAGAVHDEDGVIVSAAAFSQVRPAVTSDGANYFVVWRDYGIGGDIYGTRVSAAGIVQDPAGLMVSMDGQSRPAVASNGTDYFVATGGYQSESGWDIYGTRISASGVVQDVAGQLVSTVANLQLSPAVASNGTNYLVAWADDRSGSGWDIYGARVSAEGEVLDANGLVISGAVNEQSFPAVASNGTDYFVTWFDHRDEERFAIFGTRVSAAGEVLDPTGRLVSLDAYRPEYPAVASNGADYFVVWQDGGSAKQIYGTRVSREGVVIDASGLVVSMAPGSQTFPAVASNGTDYLVVWQDIRSGSDIYGTRVSAEGVVSGELGVEVSATAYSRFPAVTSNGGDYFVAWADSQAAGVWDIHGARVSATGVLLDVAGVVVSGAGGSQSYPAVASNGTGYFVAWQDERSGASSDIYGTRVSAAGVVQDAAGLLIAASSYAERNVAVTSSGDRRFLLLYEAFDERTQTNAARVLARLVSDTTAPVATAAGVITREDEAVAIALTGTDADDDALSFDVQSQPTNGTLTGEAPNFIYTPSLNYHGTDSFTFVANDGLVDSEPATISLTVTPVNDAPLADGQFVSMAEDGTLAITLNGSDIDGDELTYAVKTQPVNGTLFGDAPTLTYTPDANFHGTDSFTFVVNDGTVDSEPATITLSITPVNDAPLALPQSRTLVEDGMLAIALAGSDVDGDQLTYELKTEPTTGTLAGIAPNLTYTPHANFNGADAFTFVVNDGTLDSEVAMISITVTPANDAPSAGPQSVSLAEDGTLAITLGGSDLDGDELTHEMRSPPANGTLSGDAPNLTYTPNADFYGTDAFTFVANDGTLDSEPATVSITVTPVNDAPVAVSATVIVIQGEPVEFSLQAGDVDGDPLTWTIVDPPAEGTLSGNAPELSYEAPEGFRGEMSFTFKVSDGTLESNEATLTLVVSNGAPTVTVSAELLHPYEGQPVKFTATAADPGGDSLTFEWDFGDGSTSTELAPSHAYEDQGEYEVSVTVSDGLESATATLTLEVQNAAPVVVPSTDQVTGEEGVELTLQAAYSDPGVNDTLTVLWDFGDRSEPVSGEVVRHTYQDDGTFIATVTVIDSDGAETQGTREVLIANLPPVPEQVATVTVRAGEKATATLVATDQAGEADPLTWTLLDGPGELASDGSYTWQTGATDEGTFVVRAQVSDDDEGVAESVFSVEVTPVEAPSSAVPEGCGCGSSGGATSVLGFAALAMLMRVRRRIRQG